MDHGGRNQPGVAVDVDAVGRLDDALTRVGEDVSVLRRSLGGILDEIRVAVGTDRAAEVFGSRVNELGDDAGAAIDAIGAGLESHRDSLRRGVGALADTDTEIRDSITRRV